MSEEEVFLFWEAVADAAPLPACDKLPLPKLKPKTPGQRYRREAAQRGEEMDFLPATFIELIPPEAILSFKRPGVQPGVFRKLKAGEYPVEAILDLHHMTVLKARREVYRFVQECWHSEVRCALVIHGKGRGQEGEPRALLKSCVACWLPRFSEVLAFHSAQRRDGGTGAVYVLLKKGALQKERNRRRFQLAER
jgi:DNA-nicking Smr family endonuclease